MTFFFNFFIARYIDVFARALFKTNNYSVAFNQDIAAVHMIYYPINSKKLSEEMEDVPRNKK